MSRQAFGSLRLLPSGRYQVRYRHNGDRHTAPLTFTTKNAAREFLKRTEREIAAGTWRSAADETADREAVAAARAVAEAEAARRGTPFGTFAERWIGNRYNAAGKPLAPTTRAEYERLLRGPLAPLADRPVSSIDLATVQDWRAAQLAGGKVTQTARAYALLRSVLADAVHRGLLAEAPRPIRGAAGATTGKPVAPPTSDELATILDTLPERLRPFAIVAAYGGLRSGELRELRRGDVELTGGDVVLHVRRGVTHAGGRAVVGGPKTAAGVRDVLLPEVAARPLRAYMAEHVPINADALLWPASDGVSHLRQSTIARHWQRAREAAGRPDLPLHALRHYTASHYSAAGATSREVADRLGQASEGIALRYTHGTGREADLVAAMGAAARRA